MIKRVKPTRLGFLHDYPPPGSTLERVQMTKRPEHRKYASIVPSV
ncbi:hypothetical protein [Desulfitobacterium chlororespirans]|nr:hypothetical protein [Desulfitobacterium chlororespirans]